MYHYHVRVPHQAKELVSVQEFYDVYRPLLGAFWPDGIWLDGVGDKGELP